MSIAEELAKKGAMKSPVSSRVAASGQTLPKRGRPREDGGMNLRAVADVLAAEGLDPTVEIVKILKAQKPVLTRSGTQVLDADGEPAMQDVLDGDTRARVLLELQQYVAPKLKAVEVKMTGHTKSEEEIDARLAHLLQKVSK